MSGRDGSDGTEGSHANEGLPGSDGEHEMQDHLGTEDRARNFYNGAMGERLNDRMISFIDDRIMFFLSTADGRVKPIVRPGSGHRGSSTSLTKTASRTPSIGGTAYRHRWGTYGRTRRRPFCSSTGGRRGSGCTSTEKSHSMSRYPMQSTRLTWTRRKYGCNSR